MNKLVMIVLLMLFLSPLQSAEEMYTFTSQIKQTRFKHLTSELRCLVCQNETLAESGATLAADLREDIYEKIIAGQTDEAIIHYLVSRYGDFILYRPQLNKTTYLLWFGPLLFLITAFVFLIRHLRTHSEP